MMVFSHCVSVPFFKKNTFGENALLCDLRKNGSFWKINTTALGIKDILTKFTGHPVNLINMMSSKGQVYAKENVDFISKKRRARFILNSTVLCNITDTDTRH